MYKFVIVSLLAYAIVSISSVVNHDNHKLRRENYSAQEVVNKTPSELLALRGFRSEVHYVRTSDGYHIHVVRAINPHHVFSELKRPVIFNHGLLESSTIWLINSRDFTAKPFSDDLCDKTRLTEPSRANNDSLSNLAMILSNHGYDVWLMSMRGTDFSLNHDSKHYTDADFWDFCLDDFVHKDVPAVINYVRRHTKADKVGYVGHSQATFSIFGLLSERREYNDFVEPIILFTPVAYVHHVTSASRPMFERSLVSKSRYENGPYPRTSKKIRKRLREICLARSTGDTTLLCSFFEASIGGIGHVWPAGFFDHIPFYSSLKVIRHFGYIITRKKFMHYDYGPEGNRKIYGQAEAPSYDLGKITSKSLCFVWAGSDAVAHPKDVQLIKRELRVPLFKDIFVPDYNHFDLITDENTGPVVNVPLLEVFEHFERQNGVCSKKSDLLNNLNLLGSVAQADKK